MSARERLPKPVEKGAVTRDGKHPFTAEIERKEEFVENKVFEYFERHGTPDPAEINDIARTLGSVFSSDYARENSNNKASKKPKSRK